MGHLDAYLSMVRAKRHALTSSVRIDDASIQSMSVMPFFSSYHGGLPRSSMACCICGRRKSCIGQWLARTIALTHCCHRRNLKPDSIYLRTDNQAEQCSLVLADLAPASVAYDMKMRTRLPRRMYLAVVRDA
jgi:hypothetical protein